MARDDYDRRLREMLTACVVERLLLLDGGDAAGVGAGGGVAARWGATAMVDGVRCVIVDAGAGSGSRT